MAKESRVGVENSEKSAWKWESASILTQLNARAEGEQGVLVPEYKKKKWCTMTGKSVQDVILCTCLCFLCYS